jgi:hypothetical protein
MLNHSPSDYEPGSAAGAANPHVWHFHKPGEQAKDRWDPTPLILACETIAASRNGSIARIHTVFLCPEISDGALEVVEYAQALADDFGMNVHCAVSHGMITVTFERGVTTR